MSTLLAAPPTVARRLGRSPSIAAVAPVVFLVLDATITLRTLQLARADEAAHHIPLDPSFQVLVGNLGSDLLDFAPFALAGAMLARLGYRALWAAPVIIGVFGYAIGSPHVPQSLGAEWFLVGAPPWYAHPWVAATTDVVLCLAVALPFLAAPRRRPRGRPSATDLLAVLGAAVVVAITLRTTMVINNAIPPPAVIGAVCAFSLLAGASRPWPWAATAVALAVGGTLGAILWVFLPPFPDAGPVPPAAQQVGAALVAATPLVVCALVVSLWDRLGALMRSAERQPALLLIVVNALNVVDALLTQFAVRAGAAVELNPVIRAIGLPAKVVLVGLLSCFLYRRRPAALVIPAAILLAVLAYHVSGLVIDN